MQEMENLRADYFDWLYRTALLSSDTHINRSYVNLMHMLHSQPFVAVIPIDQNRVFDGLDLRNRYSIEHNVRFIDLYDDSTTCSILEMMLALAIRIETEIVYDGEHGHQTTVFFMEMLDNLHLSGFDDSVPIDYYEDQCYETLDRFVNREYDREGHGNIFTVPNPPNDMRNTEIWYQMNWYLVNKKKKEGDFWI